MSIPAEVLFTSCITCAIVALEMLGPATVVVAVVATVVATVVEALELLLIVVVGTVVVGLLPRPLGTPTPCWPEAGFIIETEGLTPIAKVDAIDERANVVFAFEVDWTSMCRFATTPAEVLTFAEPGELIVTDEIGLIKIGIPEM